MGCLESKREPTPIAAPSVNVGVAIGVPISGGAYSSRTDVPIASSPTRYANERAHITRASLSAKKQVTFLLLGTGQSGKSTIFKQLRSLYSGGNQKITKPEMANAMRWLRKELMLYILKVVDTAEEKSATDETGEYKQCSIDTKMSSYDSVIAIRDLVTNGQLEGYSLGDSLTYNKDPYTRGIELGRFLKCLKTIWNEISGVKHAYKGRGMPLHYNIPDNLNYWMKADKLDEVFSTKFDPSELDYLMYYDRTIGSTMANYAVNDWDYRFIDTGGERPERRKWVLYYDEADVVIFVAALNHFRDVLWESKSTNALLESLGLWKDVLNHKMLKDTATILIFSKIDLFKEELRNGYSLDVCFGDKWKGKNFEISRVPTIRREEMADIGKTMTDEMGKTYVISEDDMPSSNDALLEDCCEEALSFIKKEFLSVNTDTNRRIYCHTVNGLNSGSVFLEFHMIEREIVHSLLQKTPLL